MDLEHGKVRPRFDCPSCGVTLTKREVQRAYQTHIDEALGKPVRQAKSIPVLIDYSVAGRSGRFSKKPDDNDLRTLARIEEIRLLDWFPTERLPEGDESRRNDDAGYTHTHHFYTKRILAVLSAFRSYGLRQWLPFSAPTPRATRMHRIAAWRLAGPKRGGGATVGVIAGTLYIPSLLVEMNVLQQARERCRAVAKTFYPRIGAIIGTGSCRTLMLPPDSVDYIFTDPPFGASLMYSELNFLWEAWLGVFTNNTDEAIVNKTQRKGVLDYQRLMHACFAEYFRVLKPGRWMTVEFSNTCAAVWNAIQTTLEMTGFVVANVSMLDKKQGTFKAVTTPTAVKQDLIISCYKPNPNVESVLSAREHDSKSVLAFVADHLSRLPCFVDRNDTAEIIAERQAHRLFDRVIAAHVQHRRPIPMSAVEFHEELDRRYPARDGMYFLPDLVAEYDRRRTTVSELRQLSLFVTDEASAVQWVRQQLQRKLQTFQELQPQFMQQIRAWAKHEKTIELKEILDLNFFRYDGRGPVPSQIHSYLSSNFREYRNLDKDDPRLRAKAEDRWYVPDPKKEGDLERLRLRTLLREFEEYKTSPKRKIKQFRTEAVRAGFKHCCDEQDYQTIVDVAAKLPEKVIQEDEKLLMYYDVATMRLGNE